MLHIHLLVIQTHEISCLAVNDLWSLLHAYTHLFLFRHTMNENLDLTKGFKTYAIVTSFALTNYSIIHANVHSFILLGSYNLHEKNFPDFS